MLINTLFLLLREVLPLFFLLSMLLILLPPTTRLASLTSGAIFGLALSLLVQQNITDLSQWREGAGLEILFFGCAAIQLLAYAVFLLTLTNYQALSVQLLLAVSLGLLVGTCSTNFVTYFGAFLAHRGTNSSLLLGSIIGTGVSASLAILLFFFLHWCVQRGLTAIAYVMPALFFSGHFAKSFSLLEQVGLISGTAVWSTEQWLPDRSELAQIIASLSGYEATPSDWQLSAFLLSFFTLCSLILWRRHLLFSALNKEEK